MFKNKYLKYKNKYLLLTQTGGADKCFILYTKLLEIISECDEIDILEFTETCDKNYDSMTPIKNMDINDKCYRVDKFIKDKECYYSNTYNPFWFKELIQKVSKEKSIQFCLDYVNNLKNKFKKSEYKTLEVKIAEEEIDDLFEYLKCDDAGNKRDDELYDIIIDLIICENDTVKIILDKLSLHYYNVFNSMFDIKMRTNCCNCISIVLYLKGDLNSRINYLEKTLKTMIMSLKNVYKYLNNFIVRFFLDSSIFETLYQYSKQESHPILEELFMKLKFLLNHPISEIFIYFCNNIINGIEPIERVRTFRFITLFEDDTNVCIIREADGIISLVDCHNINLFSLESNHTIMMLYNIVSCFRFLNPDINIFSHIFDYDLQPGSFRASRFNHYSVWLNIYEDCFLKNENKDSYNYNTLSFIDILAGIFGMKVKINKEYLDNIIKKVNFNYSINERIRIKESIETYYKSIDLDKFKTKVYYTNDIEIILKYIYDKIDKLLPVGYDENLLLEIFSPITRVEFTQSKEGNKLNINQINIHKQLFTLVSDPIDLDPSVHEIKDYEYDYESRYYDYEYLESFFINPSKEEIKKKLGELNYKPRHSFEIISGLGSELYLKYFELKPKYKNNYLAFGLELLNFNQITEHDFNIIYN